jgi:hypothetical protein
MSTPALSNSTDFPVAVSVKMLLLRKVAWKAPFASSQKVRIRASDRQVEAYRNQPELLALWSERLAYENPSIATRLRNRYDLHALRLSDFATATRLRQLEVYDVLLRPFGIQRTIHVGYRGPHGLNEILCARGGSARAAVGLAQSALRDNRRM